MLFLYERDFQSSCSRNSIYPDYLTLRDAILLNIKKLSNFAHYFTQSLFQTLHFIISSWLKHC